MPRIVLIGECMVELSPSEDGRYNLGFAGDTFNSAWHMRKILEPEWTVQYLTNIGDDKLSGDMLRFMQESGIGTEQVHISNGKSCGLYVICLDNGERSFSYWRDTSAARSLANDQTRLAGALTGAACVVFSGITLAILTDDARSRLIAQMALLQQSGTLVVFDSNIRKRLWRHEEDCREWITRAYKVSSIALPSLADEAELFGDKDAVSAAHRIAAAGAAEVVVKDGGNPCYVHSAKGGGFIAAAGSVRVVDTTGAGDSFNAAYVAHRLQGASAEMSAARAHALAAKVIGGYGALVD